MVIDVKAICFKVNEIKATDLYIQYILQFANDKSIKKKKIKKKQKERNNNVDIYVSGAGEFRE